MPWWEQAKCNINWDTHQVNISSNGKSGNVTLGQTTASSLNVVEILPTLESLLAQYEDVFSEAPLQTLPKQRASNLCIELIPDKTPKWGKVYPTTHAQGIFLKDYIS
ncbi:hypothetical protein DSO57_1004434 [Entomophthora muscae]|uniref:Uncharacterized protein n=1 Tax=Entomophthora muscae TaxID=34485 RepID=A0ACC2TJ75_9FUNG|nr:hypothetical protein DSO57_1004434 [Entomophthora muscae]